MKNVQSRLKSNRKKKRRRSQWNKHKRKKQVRMRRRHVKKQASAQQFLPAACCDQPEDDVPVDRNKHHPLDIFRFPIINWDYRWQRPQQLMVQFAKDGHRVFYFAVETIPLHTEDAAYEEIRKNVKITQVQDRVWTVQLCSKSSLNAYRTVIQDPTDLKYLEWSIQVLKARFNIAETLTIVDLPFWTPLVLRLPDHKVIYDCMDEHSGFSNTSDELLSIEPHLMEHSDLVMTSSQSLYDKVIKRNPRTVLIRNGGEYEHFSSAPDAIANELTRLNRPVIGYFGTIADWFDMQLVQDLAKRNRDWTFVLVGDHYWSDWKKLKGQKNVIFVGEKPYAELPKYLYGFDVCIIPFVMNPLTLATNPVKIYEYLASGKPVVSVKLPEIELMQDLVYMAEDSQQFEDAIRSALNENDPLMTLKRQAFAAQNTWEGRYLQIKQEIRKRFYPKISIIILTHNNWNYTKQCLNSVFNNTDYPDFEVIVVDNGSSDQTKRRLSRIQSRRLKVLFSPDNLGYAAGNELGIKMAEGDYFILLNNDTNVPAGWIRHLLKPLRENDEIGLAGPVSNHVGNDQTLDHFVGDPIAGADPNWLEEYYELNKGRYRSTELLGFYCVAIKREVYEKVGPLDTGYKIGMFEDDDYCERVMQAGYKLAVVEDAFVYHHGSRTIDLVGEAEKKRIFYGNRLRFEHKWGKRWRQPNKPENLFRDAAGPADLIKKLNQFGHTRVLLLGKRHWGHAEESWHRAAIKHCVPELLVLSYVLTHFGKDIHGIRKAGPMLYLTNRIDWLEHVPFDLVVYCGEQEVQERIVSKEYYIEPGAYSDSEKSELDLKLRPLYEERLLNDIKEGAG